VDDLRDARKCGESGAVYSPIVTDNPDSRSLSARHWPGHVAHFLHDGDDAIHILSGCAVLHYNQHFV
jgi:hypothetical protein